MDSKKFLKAFKNSKSYIDIVKIKKDIKNSVDSNTGIDITLPREHRNLIIVMEELSELIKESRGCGCLTRAGS